MAKQIKRQNPHNKLITAKDLEEMFYSAGMDLKVKNIEIYRKAFVHRSYLKHKCKEPFEEDCIPLQDDCNESYEFLGDTILNSVVGSYLYERFPFENEGFLTKTRTKMVRGVTLGEISKRLDFGKWVLISQHVEAENGRENLRILEDLFESFIGAIYLDNGCETIANEWTSAHEEYYKIRHDLKAIDQKYTSETSETIETIETSHEVQAYIEDLKIYREKTNRLFQLQEIMTAARSNGYLYCQKFIMNCYEKYIDLVKLIVFDDNYKDRLQSYFQKRHGIFPTWHVIKEEGKTNQRWHTIGVHDRCGFLIGTGRERKKTDAEQTASRNALIYLGVISEDYGNDFFK